MNVGVGTLLAIAVGLLIEGTVIYFAVQLALNDHVDALRREIHEAADRIVKAINTRP